MEFETADKVNKEIQTTSATTTIRISKELREQLRQINKSPSIAIREILIRAKINEATEERLGNIVRDVIKSELDTKAITLMAQDFREQHSSHM